MKTLIGAVSALTLTVAMAGAATAAYDDVDVTANPSARRELRERTGHRTVPVIFVDGTFVGGYVELRALWRRGELDALRATA